MSDRAIMRCPGEVIQESQRVPNYRKTVTCLVFWRMQFSYRLDISVGEVRVGEVTVGGVTVGEVRVARSIEC